MRCLEKDPAERYQTADDLLIDIEGLSTPAETLTGSGDVRSRRDAEARGGLNRRPGGGRPSVDLSVGADTSPPLGSETAIPEIHADGL